MAAEQKAAREVLVVKQAQEIEEQEEKLKKDKEVLEEPKAGYLQAHSNINKNVDLFKASVSKDDVWEIVDELYEERASKRRKLNVGQDISPADDE